MMTPDDLEIKSVNDGWMARVMIVQLEDDIPNFQYSHQRLKEFPTPVMQQLYHLMAQANELDNLYANPQVPDPIDRLKHIVLDEQAQKIRLQLEDLDDEYLRLRTHNEVTQNHTILNRLVQNSVKVAGTLAAFENPWADPIVITPEHLCWSTGYIAQNLIKLLADLDSDKVGQGSNDEVKAVVRMFKEYLDKARQRKRGCVSLPKREFQNKCAARKPFYGGRGPIKATALAGQTIKYMLENGYLQAAVDPAEIMMTDDPIWKN
jgi:hypothetical protein